jgi:hypothetical protein
MAKQDASAQRCGLLYWDANMAAKHSVQRVRLPNENSECSVCHACVHLVDSNYKEDVSSLAWLSKRHQLSSAQLSDTDFAWLVDWDANMAAKHSVQWVNCPLREVSGVFRVCHVSVY